MARWALHDDWALLRYLRANRMHVDKAAKALMATARWRLAEGVDEIRVDALLDGPGSTSSDAFKEGRMYVSTEHDPYGRSIIVYRKSGAAQTAADWADPAAYKRELHTLVYTLERAIRSMEDRATSGHTNFELMDYKWTFLVDLGSYTSTSATPWHVTRSLIDVLRHHYPERLHFGVLVEPPAFLRALFMPLKLVLPSVTVRKVVFLDDRSSDKTLEQLTAVTGSLDVLPFESGIVGARTKFDAEKYVRSDPMGRPRPINLQQLEDIQEGRVPPLVGSQARLRPALAAASTEASSGGAHSSRSWWQVWKRS